LIQISSSIFDGLPRHPEVAAFIHPDGVWAHDAVQIAVDNAARIDVDLKVPTWEESVEVVLSGAALEHSLSDKGRIASRMHELAASQALLVPNAFDVVRRLTTPRSPDLLRALREARLAGNADERLIEI